MKCEEIINIMEELAPKNLAESWDNVGLQIGDIEGDIKRVLITLDVTDEVVDEAIGENIDMIIAHHPFIFHPISNITMDDSKGRMINKLIKNDINLYVSHTNMDIAHGGLNDMLVEKLKLENIRVLSPSHSEKLYKIVVFVPEGYENDVRNVLGDSETGWIGNYSHCTFQTQGTGTFKPLEGSDPFIGKINDIEKVKEYRIETIVNQKNLSNVIAKMIEAHPYEEVAYDVYPLQMRGKISGLGRIGEYKNPILFEELINGLKNILDIDILRVSGTKKEYIKKVGLCTGSGVDFMMDAARHGVDVYITGDVKYHEAQIAQDLNMLLVDAGHFSTEIIFMEGVKEYLDEKLSHENIHVRSSQVNEDVFKSV